MEIKQNPLQQRPTLPLGERVKQARPISWNTLAINNI